MCGCLLNSDDSKHLLLSTVQTCSSGLPEEWQTIVSHPGKRVDFQVKVPQYGAGIVSFFTIIQN